MVRFPAVYENLRLTRPERKRDSTGVIVVSYSDSNPVSIVKRHNLEIGPRSKQRDRASPLPLHSIGVNDYQAGSRDVKFHAGVAATRVHPEPQTDGIRCVASRIEA